MLSSLSNIELLLAENIYIEFGLLGTRLGISIKGDVVRQ